ncbi:hypothetical protein [Hymenobacter algoricola]|uniref:Uncharacterized protein n=1 Tax=Hymenobacter algoricola TaxID=486267 RepID=A0ABP7NEA4_9BACT
MYTLLRVLWGVSWRLALSMVGYYGCAVGGESLQRLLRGDFRTPTPEKISIALTFFTFCCLAVGVAVASQLRRDTDRPRPFPAVFCLLYAGVTLFLFGVFFGALERPYRLLFTLACGWSGLVAPWALESAIRWRTSRATAARTNSSAA